MALTEDLYIYKDTLLLCKILLKYSNSLMGVLVHYNTYNIRSKAWTMMPHKDRLYCKNMKVIKIMNKFKV